MLTEKANSAYKDLKNFRLDTEYDPYSGIASFTASELSLIRLNNVLEFLKCHEDYCFCYQNNHIADCAENELVWHLSPL